MRNEIRILYLEDIPAEAARLDYELHKSGLHFRSRRVDTEQDFLKELEQPPDLILSDHGLPSFDGLSALALVQERCPDVPFIFVTSSLTLAMEVEKLSGSVSDYVLKNHLEYLPLAVRRALRTAEESRLRRRLLEELRAQVEFISRNKLMLPICSECKRVRDEQNLWKPPEIFFRELLKIEFTHGLCPECIPKFFSDKAGRTTPAVD